MTFTKTIDLDFGVPYVDATVTLEEESPREAMPGDLTQGWYIAFRDTAAEMWDFR